MLHLHFDWTRTVGDSFGYLRELLNAVHALGLLGGVDEAAESSLELLAARAVSHAAQARAVPVDLASLGVEGALGIGLLLESLRGGASLGDDTLSGLRLGLGIALGHGLSLGLGLGDLFLYRLGRCRRGGSGLSGSLGSLPGGSMLGGLASLLFDNGIDGGKVGVGQLGGGGTGRLYASLPMY